MEKTIADNIPNVSILVVDDNEQIRFGFKEILENVSFNVKVACDFFAAKKLLENQTFDTVFVDIALPGTNGIELLKEIKRLQPDTPVIMITGDPKIETASDAVRLGAYDYLTKPVMRHVLIRVAKRAADTKKLKEEKRCVERENRIYRENLEKLVEKRTLSLRESKKRYVMATSAGKTGVWDWHLETNALYVDPNLKAMLGYANHETWDNFDDWVRLVHPDDDVGRLMAEAKTHIEGLTPKYESTHRMLHRDGSSHWFLCRGTVIRDATGKPYRLLGTGSDITDQKLAEEKLDRRDAILKAVRFAAETFLRSTDWKQNINEVLMQLGLAASASRVYIFENNRSENGDLLVSQRYEWTESNIKPEIDNPALEKFPYGVGGYGRWEEVLSKGGLIKGNVSEFPESERDLLRTQHILSIVIVPIFVEKQWWGFLGFDECLVDRDLSSPEIEALKVAASTMGAAMHSERQDKERMRLVTAIEQSAESVVITNSDGIIQYVNPTFESVTGYKKDEAIGKNPSFLKSGRQDDLFYREMWETLKNGNVWHGHFVNKKKGGGMFDEVATISPVKDVGGKIMNYVAIKRDVTGKKRLESIAEVSNLMDNIGYVFSGIRHEIGNPVNAIKMTLTVLNRNLETFDRETVQEFLDRSLNEISRVEYLLKALKNFSMFESPSVENMEINSFMTKFFSLIAGDFRKRGIIVEPVTSAGSRTCIVDPRALQQVMLNLMTNAADALRDRKDPRIAIGIIRVPGWLQIKVRDNGCGMSKKQQKDLFKPFITSKPEGTGLGLVIVKKMLSEMNCAIEIESRVDVGTTVTISVPEGQ